MPYNPVPTVATGDLWTASNHNTYIRDNFAAGVPDIFTTKGDLAVASAANAAGRLAVGANGQRLVADSSQSLGMKWAADDYVIGMLLYAGGGPLSAGIAGDIEVPMAGTIQRVTALADQSGTILLDIRKSTYAAFPPGASICGSNLPGVFGSSSQITGTVSKSAGSATLTGSGTNFTGQLQVGDVIDVPGGTATERRMVTAITSATSLTVNETFAYSASGQACYRMPATTKRQDTSLAGWTTGLSAGDIVRFVIYKASKVTRVTISLLIRKS